MKKNKSIFFDRDGTVNFRSVGDYIKTPGEFHFLDDFLRFFIFIKKLGYLAIIVSNQQGIGKGIMTEKDLQNVHIFMQKKIWEQTGFKFDDIFHCPDLAESNSHYRKPNPGMLVEAIDKWNIQIENSWMIGDSSADVIAGKKAGLHTILIGNNSLQKKDDADYTFLNFDEALIKIKNLL